MAGTWHCRCHIYMLLFMTMLSAGSACVLPASLRIPVPAHIHAGRLLSPVPAHNCEDDYDTTELFTTSDPRFSAGRAGIVALADLTVPPAGWTFAVWRRDAGGHESQMEVKLVRRVRGVQGAPKRVKREWRPPPFSIRENQPPPFPKDLDHIGSNSAQNFSVYYTASGPGITEDPVGLLSLDERGLLRIHRPIDREQYPEIKFIARVFDQSTHRETDLPLPITVIVEDENDNKPEFTGPQSLWVAERSKIGTLVGRINATDRDKENTPHTKISYSLQTGQDMFAIDPESGDIRVNSDQLDRETQETHFVIVKIQDMGGSVGGLTSTGTVTIHLKDVNDNPPTFKRTSYNANIEENTKGKLILRIPVEDKDLKNTPNWNSKFVIEGDGKENFRIERDPKTNDGLLYIDKPLDYEKNKDVTLNIQAQNEAKLVGSQGSWLSIPVNIAVGNVDEGPEFTAPTISFNVKENTANGTVIGKYMAVDPETRSSNGIKYYKVSDPGSWVNVDMKSGELKVANTIDRESSLVQGGVYNVTVKAVDATSKSATGTVILIVEDENDNTPTLPTAEMVICEREGQLGSVVVNALDPDQSPYAGPFTFNLPKDHDGNWNLNTFNATAVTLQQTQDLHVGFYEVPVMVTDLQGEGKLQTVKVKVCKCRNGVCLSENTSIDLGPLGILALLLPLLLLLLLGVLLALFCSTKHKNKNIDDIGESGGMLLKSNIEVPGEEVVDSKLIIGPTIGTDYMSGSAKGSLLNVGWVGNKSSSTIGGHSIVGGLPGVNQGLAQGSFSQTQYDQYNQYGTGQFGQFEESHYLGNNMGANSGQHIHEDLALNHTWQTNGRYLQQKLTYFGGEQDECCAEDALRVYGFEGVGSAAGSVGCCSDFGQQEDMGFLNTLGPKFKTLADVCVKK